MTHTLDGKWLDLDRGSLSLKKFHWFYFFFWMDMWNLELPSLLRSNLQALGRSTRLIAFGSCWNFFFLFHLKSSLLWQALLLAGFGSEGVQLIPLGNTSGLPHDNFNLLLLSSVTPWLLGHNFFISQGHKLYKCPLRRQSTARVYGRQFFRGLAVGRISGWFKKITFIVHFISIFITSAPPQMIRH